MASNKVQEIANAPTRKSNLPIGLPKNTQSLCPECKSVIDAKIFEENGKVMIEKECKEHGKFKDVYWSDVDLYLNVEAYAYDGEGISNPRTEVKTSCPGNCGLCDEHLSHTALGNLDLTNRCNLKCPICFANANAAGYVYEPSFNEVVKMLENLRANKPVPGVAVQFSGGEPTIYPQFFEAVAKAKDLGFSQIQVATNGIKMAKDPNFAVRMRDAGVKTVYLQFDGFKDEDYVAARGVPLLKTKLQAIENARNVKPRPLGIMLVPTIVNTINDDQCGDIVKFAVKNIEVIRGVNFQPVSFTGRISQEEREKERFTLPDLVDRLKKQTGFIDENDWFPVPCVSAISDFVGALRGEDQIKFTAHPHCGIATFLYVENGNAIPITRFLDADGLFAALHKITEKSKGKKLGTIDKLKLVGLRKYIDKDKAPKELKLSQVLKNILGTGQRKAIAEFVWKTQMIGGMHFQDLYNYDIDRVRRCVIHYTVPDGRIIPFCSYNGGPFYREEIEQKFSIPLEEYRNQKKA